MRDKIKVYLIIQLICLFRRCHYHERRIPRAINNVFNVVRSTLNGLSAVLIGCVIFMIFHVTYWEATKYTALLFVCGYQCPLTREIDARALIRTMLELRPRCAWHRP